MTAKSSDRTYGDAQHHHPSFDIRSESGTELAGKKIVLCVTGSVAVYKAIELARLLMRHGADVTCVASRAATRLIGPQYLKWATGNDVVTKLTGDLEHIRLADYNRSDQVVVYPATASTIGRLANGTDDGAVVSATLTVALGSGIPILICPAMHESMYENPAVRRNIDFLREQNVEFIQPSITEGKAKVPEPEQILDYILSRTTAPLAGKNILITAGPTVEFIDPVRVITNLSSGRTGVLLAAEFLAAGADVTMVYGPGREEPPGGVNVVRVQTGQEMLDAIKGLECRFDVVIMAAAVSDYAPANRSQAKIASASMREYALNLKRVPKIINVIREIQKDAMLVGFKALADVSRNELVDAGRAILDESGADLVVANDVGRRYQENQNFNNVIVMDRNGTTSESGWQQKESTVRFIRREIEGRMTLQQG